MSLPTIDLKTATDAEINAAVAEHCDGWTEIFMTNLRKAPSGAGFGDVIVKRHYAGIPPAYRLDPVFFSEFEPVPDYLHDANAVLPLLEKSFYTVQFLPDRSGERYGLFIKNPVYNENDSKSYGLIDGRAISFCRAACIALIKASGKIEVRE
jgi:hypothetical protein